MKITIKQIRITCGEGDIRERFQIVRIDGGIETPTNPPYGIGAKLNYEELRGFARGMDERKTDSYTLIA